MKVFYARVSTEEQNAARQETEADRQGAEKIFIDKASGKNADRPQLKALLQFVREGDTVIVSEIARMARNVKDLLTITADLEARGVSFVSVRENIDTTTPQGKFMLTVFAAMAQLERDCILQRQAEGIAEAKKRGAYKGRKPMEIDDEKFAAMCAEWRKGERTATSIQREFGISAQTFYRWTKEKNL